MVWVWVITVRAQLQLVELVILRDYYSLMVWGNGFDLGWTDVY